MIVQTIGSAVGIKRQDLKLSKKKKQHLQILEVTIKVQWNSMRMLIWVHHPGRSDSQTLPVLGPWQKRKSHQGLRITKFIYSFSI